MGPTLTASPELDDLIKGPPPYTSYSGGLGVRGFNISNCGGGGDVVSPGGEVGSRSLNTRARWSLVAQPGEAWAVFQKDHRGRCSEVGCGLGARSPAACGNHLRGFYKAQHPHCNPDESNPTGRGAAWASVTREGSR